MRLHGRVHVAIAVMAAAGLLVGCSGTTGTSPAPQSSVAASQPSSSPPAPTSAPSAEASRTPEATPPPITVTTGLEYESADPLLPSQALDVYAPAEAGPYPVAVMLHGGPGVINRDWTAGWASLVAAEGFVVFAPTWGGTGPEARTLPQHEKFEAVHRQVACAVAFAREHAAEYGGDPSTLVMFGHSGGANGAATVAFNDVAPTDGCPSGDSTGPVSAVITYEGDWLFHDPMWDQIVPDDPAMLDAGLPWPGLSSHPELPVVMLVSEGSGGLVEVPTGDPPVDSWKTARDPRLLREQFMTAGADGNRINIAQTQAILREALAAQGNPVSLTEIPGADHMTLGLRGRTALLDAFREALGE